MKHLLEERLAFRGCPPGALELAHKVREEHLSYCTPRQLASLASLCARAERLREPGQIIEAGCARGGSSLLLCAVKSPYRPLNVYDVFGMIPPPSNSDGDDMQARYRTIASGNATDPHGGKYYAYEEDLKERVAEAFRANGFSLEEHRVSLIKGIVQETLHVTEPVCLAHVDVDWYEPVKHCLEQIVPKLSPHGAIVLHAYNDWSGCRKATDEYFATRRGDYHFDNAYGHLIVRRA